MTTMLKTQNNISLPWSIKQGISLEKTLYNLHLPVFIGMSKNKIIATNEAYETGTIPVSGFTQPLIGKDLGDTKFKKQHNVKYAYHGGAMANGIASVELVIALGKAGFLGSFGAAGLTPNIVEDAIKKIQKELPNGPYAVNVIHSPQEEALERGVVDVCIKMGVKTIEASAYLGLTEHIVYYRVAGLDSDQNGNIRINNKIIAKISRTEIAKQFMEPAPKKYLKKLLAQGKITKKQSEYAQLIPMADDITAEADSGGHTDNRPFITLLPSIISLRDQIQDQYNYKIPLRVGAGGGIGTAYAALAAFTMGAAYIVIGSINQSCIEAGASEHTRKLLSKADMADVTMAPAADMFEMGVKLQVLKRGTMFAMRAQKLYDLYITYESIDSIPLNERKKIEQQIFRSDLETIWGITLNFFKERDPEMLSRAQNNPKRKMALIFRWYLGLSSRWSNHGEKGREIDYQIWAGPALGAFNAWAKGSKYENYKERKVAILAKKLLDGAAYLMRINQLKNQGIEIPNNLQNYLL